MDQKPRLSPYWDRWTPLQRVVYLVLFFGGLVAVRLGLKALFGDH